MPTTSLRRCFVSPLHPSFGIDWLGSRTLLTSCHGFSFSPTTYGLLTSETQKGLIFLPQKPVANSIQHANNNPVDRCSLSLSLTESNRITRQHHNWAYPASRERAWYQPLIICLLRNLFSAINSLLGRALLAMTVRFCIQCPGKCFTLKLLTTERKTCPYDAMLQIYSQSR